MPFIGQEVSSGESLMNQNPDSNNSSPHPAPQSRNREPGFKGVLSLLRLFVFTLVIIGTAVLTFPPEYILFIVQNTWIIGAAVIGATLLVGTVYFLQRPSNTLISISFDLEAIGIIVVSMITILLLGVTTILSSTEPNVVTFGLILTAIYTFYIYRTIKETIKVRNEGEVIRTQYGQLQELDKEKSDFIMITSHQLRTPLTEIRWGLESVLRDKNLGLPTQEITRKSVESVGHLAKIVDQMVKAQISGNMQNNSVSFKPVDAISLIEKVITDLDLFAKEKGASVHFTYNDENIFLNVDEEKIKIALENLIDNAIRYSPGGNVVVSISQEGRLARIRVQDTGIGIDPQDYNRIFTKFFRAKNALLVQPDGSGIGLYAVKRIIENHGGTVSFLSKLKEGTTFIVTLPLA